MMIFVNNLTNREYNFRTIISHMFWGSFFTIHGALPFFSFFFITASTEIKVNRESLTIKPGKRSQHSNVFRVIRRFHLGAIGIGCLHDRG